ncbi:MAG: class I SAM-dependent methyltransferase, partial [Proteobacteria bacterium]|nr:class I SAM-dependent methyltransferase [Pseudomonadota bacterium]
MTETRGYQTDFSTHNDYVFDLQDRRRKAETIRCVLNEELGSIIGARVLNVGGGAGAIDYCLAPCVKQVISVDIDQQSMKYGAENFSQENLSYSVADGMKLPFTDDQFDVVLCSHVYEHVPDANILMSEI